MFAILLALSILMGCQSRQIDKVEVNTHLVIADPKVSGDFAYRQVLSIQDFYKDLHVLIDIEQISLASNPVDALAYPAKHLNKLCIIYVPYYPTAPAAVSSFPWDQENNVIIVYESKYNATMWHEFGHWVGLLHTHQEDSDLVEDTPPTQGNFADPNVMGYNFCQDSEQTITKGQLERAWWFLINDRKNFCDIRYK